MKRFATLLALFLVSASAFAGILTGPNFTANGSGGSLTNIFTGTEITVGKSNAMFGPFTPGTTTEGIQEALNYLGPASSTNAMPGVGVVKVGPGHYQCSTQLIISNSFPMSVTIVGAGLSSTLIEYTNTTRQDFVITSPNTSAYQQGDLIFQDLALLYKNQFTNWIVRLTQIDTALFRNVMFATSDVYTNNKIFALFNVPTPRGPAGVRVNNGNKCLYDHCSFYGLSFGSFADGASTAYRSCDFIMIGTYYNGSVQYTNLWTFGGGVTESAYLSLGCAVGCDNINSYVTIDDCDFSTCNGYYMSGMNDARCEIINPQSEFMHYSVLSYDQASAIFILHSTATLEAGRVVTAPRTITSATPYNLYTETLAASLFGPAVDATVNSNTVYLIDGTGAFSAGVGFIGNGRDITNATFFQAADYITGAWVTNTSPNMWTVETDVRLVGTNVAGNASMAVFMNATPITTIVGFSNKVSLATTALALFAQTNIEHLKVDVNPGATFSFSNTSVGSGNSSAIISGTGSRTTHP